MTRVRELGKPQPCPKCEVPPNQPHEDYCDWARCAYTGEQQIQCEGEHDGLCRPHTHDGYYAGELQCYELGLFTDENSFWGIGPDLNTFFTRIIGWDQEAQRYIV